MADKAKKSSDTVSLTISADFTSDSNNAEKAVKIIEPKDSDVMETYDHNAIAVNMVQFQVDYHFSDSNLQMDNYLLCRMHENKDYWVPIKTIANLTKIKSITEDPEIVLKAIRASDKVILNEDETKVKRPNFVPPKPKHHKNLRRTVFIYGIPKNYTKKEILEICEPFGKVKSIAFDIQTNQENVNDNDNDSNNKNKNDKKESNKDKKENKEEKEEQNKEANKEEKKEEKKAEKNEKDEENKTEKKVNNKEQKQPEQQKQQKTDSERKEKTQPKKNDNKKQPRASILFDVFKPDHTIAITIMTKKFGPKAVRSNSSFTVTNRSSQSPVINNDVMRASTHSNATVSSNSFDFAVEPVAPHAPVYVHPVPNPNGDPLDFSHLKSCFVIFESQSQANKCVKTRSRSDDGIRSMTQYDYNQFKKRVSLATARGISPLISPNSIGLALTSPTFALLGSQRHSHHHQQQNKQLQQQQQQQLLRQSQNLQTPQYYAQGQQFYQPNAMNGSQPNNAMAMDYYLANSQVTLTMSELQQLIEQMQKKPQTAPNRNSWHSNHHNIQKHLSRNMMGNKNYQKQRRNTHHNSIKNLQRKSVAMNQNKKYNNNNPQPRNTWSHRQQSQNPKIFDFHGNNKKQNNYNRKSTNNKHVSFNLNGAKTSTNRYKSRGSVNNYNNNRKRMSYQNNGRFPPAPSPNNSFGNAQPTIIVNSNTPVYYPNSHLMSPAISPQVSIIRGPAQGFGIMDRNN